MLSEFSKNKFQQKASQNSNSSLGKSNYDREGVWIADLNKHRCLRFYLSVFSLVLVSVKTLFDHISEQLQVCLKYFIAHCVFGSETSRPAFVNVVKHAPCFAFDLLLQNPRNCASKFRIY